MTLAGAAHAVRVRSRRISSVAAWRSCIERFRTPYVAIVDADGDRDRARGRRGSFEKLAIIANGSILLVYVGVLRGGARAAAARRSGRAARRSAFRSPASFRVLAIAAIVWLLASLTADEWKALLVVFGVAIVVYVASLPSRRARERRAARRRRRDATIRCSSFRAEFPILERTTYLVSNSLGAMPRGVPERLAEYVDQWAELGVRAWAKGWWDDAGDRRRRDRAAHRRGAGRSRDAAERDDRADVGAVGARLHARRATRS